MTLVIAGALGGIAAALIERIYRAIAQSDALSQVKNVRKRGIRRHKKAGGLWDGGHVDNEMSDYSNEDTVTIHSEPEPKIYRGRHRAEPDEIDDFETTEIIDQSKPLGRHHVDNKNRDMVTGIIERITWANGDVTANSVWQPIIGRRRIAILATNTSAYTIARIPLHQAPRSLTEAVRFVDRNAQHIPMTPPMYPYGSKFGNSRRLAIGT